MARLPLEHTRSNHQRIQPSSTRRTSWCAALPWDVAKKARAMELALEDWLSTKNGEKRAELLISSSSASSTPSSTSTQNGSPNLEIRQQKSPAPPPGGTFSTTSPPKISVSLPAAAPNPPPASTAVRVASAVSPSPSTSSSTSVPATSSAPSLKDGAPSSITFATNPAPTTTDESLLLNGGTSTFNGFNTATATGFPSGLVVASATSTPTPSSGATATKSTSQKLTPYLIAAGSVGGFVVSIIVIYLVLRCRKRTKLGRPKSLERDPREPTPPPDFGDMMSYSGSKGGMDNDSYRSKSVSTASPQFSQGSPFAPPPLKVARSSFMGRERGDLVRATINRHPLATLDEHSFFRSDNNNTSQSNISNMSPTNDDVNGWNEKSNFSAPRRPSLAQQISNGANRDPVPPVPRANSAKNSPAHSVSPVVSIADEIGIGLGVLPLNPRQNNDPAVPPYMQTHSGTRRPSPPYMQTHSATRRPSPPGRRSSFKELSQLSFNSQPDNINPGAPPSSIRESVATTSANTILENRASVTTSVVSVPRFRSVNGWVDYQTNRFERKGSEPHDTPPAAPMIDGAEIGLASSDETDDDALRMNSNTSSIVTVRPWNYAAHTNSPVGAGEANERNPTTTPTRRSSWETEREPRTPHRTDDEDVFSDAMEHYPMTPTPLQPPPPQTSVTPPQAPAQAQTAAHPIFGYGDDGKPAAVSTTPPSRDNGRPTHPPLASTNNEIAPWHNQRDRAAAKATDMRRMDSTSTATVFRYHPGEEVKLGRTSRVESVVLDESMGVDRKVSSASRGLGGM